MKYSDIVGSYSEYLRLQQHEYCSFESEDPRAASGQRRYLDLTMAELPRTAAILDVGCGDGVGLRHLKLLGFTNVTGVELNPAKAARARETGLSVMERDMHDLRCFAVSHFDVVYSSHTLEHAYYAGVVLDEIRRVLKPSGLLLVVLPYPDVSDWNLRAHGAKYEIGTAVVDAGKTVIEFFVAHGFGQLNCRFDCCREPEIWLSFSRTAKPARNGERANV